VRDVRDESRAYAQETMRPIYLRFSVVDPLHYSTASLRGCHVQKLNRLVSHSTRRKSRTFESGFFGLGHGHDQHERTVSLDRKIIARLSRGRLAACRLRCRYCLEFASRQSILESPCELVPQAKAVQIRSGRLVQWPSPHQLEISSVPSISANGRSPAYRHSLPVTLPTGRGVLHSSVTKSGFTSVRAGSFRLEGHRLHHCSLDAGAHAERMRSADEVADGILIGSFHR
jgi:hypothetical protein